MVYFIPIFISSDEYEESEPQFEAHSLEAGEDDWVVARLRVHSLTLEQSSQDFYLEARNKFSEVATVYKFYLKFNPKSTTTTTTTTTTTSTTTTTTFLQRFKEAEEDEERVRVSSTMSLLYPN